MMANYEKTTATVVDGRIGTAIGGDGKMSFIPVIAYRYQVNGQEYINDRFTQNPVGRRQQGAVQKILNKYPSNSTIDIFYNPNNPSESFVQKGFGGGVNLLLMTMLFGSLIVLVIALVYAESQSLINLF